MPMMGKNSNCRRICLFDMDGTITNTRRVSLISCCLIVTFIFAHNFLRMLSPIKETSMNIVLLMQDVNVFSNVLNLLCKFHNIDM